MNLPTQILVILLQSLPQRDTSCVFSKELLVTDDGKND